MQSKVMQSKIVQSWRELVDLRSPTEPAPPPIEEPPDAPESPTAPVQEPDPVEPEHV